MRQHPRALLLLLLLSTACRAPEAIRQTQQPSSSTSGDTLGGPPGRIVGTELHIANASGDELRVDSNGLYFKTSTGETFKVKNGTFEWTTSWGRMYHSGNELKIESTIDDPAKVRLASPGRNVSAVSFNQLGAEGRHEELAMIMVGPTEDDPSSLGGEMRFSAKRKNASDDAAMRLMGVISSGYTGDPDPTVRFKDLNGLGPYSQRDYGQ